MPVFTPQQLQSFTGGTWLGGRCPAGCVSGFTQDSRQLKAGMCFVALQTAQRDGHAFLPAALAAGAAMALVSRADVNCTLPQLVVEDTLRAFQQIARAHRLQFGGKVVGVTGSCGKTSTKNILRTLLGDDCHATEGNLNNFIGVPLTLLALETGAEGVGHGADANQPSPAAFAVIEAGISEPGEMAVLADMIRPDIAVITMVGAAHLQDLGSVEGVAAEKAVLAHKADVAGGSTATAGATATSAGTLPLLFAPLECFKYSAFAALENAGVAVAPAECNGDADSRLKDALPTGVTLHHYDLELVDKPQDGAEAFLSIKGQCLGARFALGFSPSSGMASNLALALIAAHTLGVPVELLQQRVRNWQPQGNRGSWKQVGAQRFFVDCYNANPASMEDSLSHFTASLAVGEPAVRDLPRLYVIGGMRELGAQSVSLHHRLGLFLGSLLADAKSGAVITIGEPADNAALEAGLRVHASQVSVHSFTQTEDARPIVEAFEGVVFLKGSRFYTLETLLPQPPPA